MKYKLILMFILSILAHITIAGALVYVPYQITMQNQESLGGEVIWGKIYKAEGRRQKAEGRSKKLEARSSAAEQVSSSQIRITVRKEDSLPLKGRALSFSPPQIEKAGGGQGEPRNSLPLFKGGQGGVFSDEPVMNHGSQKETQIHPLCSRGGWGGLFG